MNDQRIIPTLALLAGLGTAVALACHTGAEAEAARNLLRSLLSPPAARAGEAADAQQPAATSVIRNPFIDSQSASMSPEQRTAEPTAAAAQPKSTTRERYRATPALEAVRYRRTNPQLAEADCCDTCQEGKKCSSTGITRTSAETLSATPEQPADPPVMLESRAIDRYSRHEDAEVTPAGHNEPVPVPMPESEPIPEQVEQQPVDEPTTMNELTPELAPEQGTTRPVEPAPSELAPIDATDRSSGGISLEWLTPSNVTVGQEATCRLVVRNKSESVAQGVLVEAQLPEGVDLGSTEPAAQRDGRLIVWRLGDMAPGATTTAQLNFVPHEQGEVSPRAAVTFTRQVAATIQIVEPRLSMSIEGPQESVVGQPAACHFRVKNEGTGPAMNVAVDVALQRGLSATGAKPRYTIGTLGPGESRHVQLLITAAEQGDFVMQGRAVVGERAMERVSHTIRIVQPALAVEMDGPKLRFVDRKAAYTIKVKNPGPAPIDNVQLLENVPDGFRFVEASSGGSYDRQAKQVAWFVGRLEANETATVGVQLIAVEAGDHRLNAAAKADFGVIGEAETNTRVKGSPRVTIDVTEDDDPVEVDGETVYRIRLVNQGSTPAQRVQFAGEVPAEMQILDVNGPDPGVIKGRQLVFPAVAVLEPGQSISYDVHVKCQKAGQVRFKAYFRSEDSPSATLEEEATRIYAD